MAIYTKFCFPPTVTKRKSEGGTYLQPFNFHKIEQNFFFFNKAIMGTVPYCTYVHTNIVRIVRCSQICDKK